MILSWAALNRIVATQTINPVVTLLFHDHSCRQIMAVAVDKVIAVAAEHMIVAIAAQQCVPGHSIGIVYRIPHAPRDDLGIPSIVILAHLIYAPQSMGIGSRQHLMRLARHFPCIFNG